MLSTEEIVTSWTGWAASIGMMLGSFAAMIVTLPAMAAWAWRVPFLIGFLICICGVYLRRRFGETPEFLLSCSNGLTVHAPLLKVLQKHLKRFTVAAVLAAAYGIYLYVGNIFYASFLIHAAHLLSYQAKLVVTVGALFIVLFFPLMARLADRIGGAKLIRCGFLLIILVGPVLYWVALTRSLTLILLTQVLYAIADAMTSAPLFRFINNLFPTNVRYTGASFAWSISMALFGGTASLLSTWLETRTHLNYAPALYISLAGMVGLLSLIYATKTGKEENDDAAPETLGP